MTQNRIANAAQTNKDYKKSKNINETRFLSKITAQLKFHVKCNKAHKIKKKSLSATVVIIIATFKTYVFCLTSLWKIMTNILFRLSRGSRSQ